MKRLVKDVFIIMVFCFGMMFQKNFANAETDFSTAQQIQVNTQVTGNVTEGYDYEEDIYMFYLVKDGSVTINFRNPLQKSKETYWKVSLWNGEFDCLLEREIEGAIAMRDLPSIGLAAGTYYIKVTSTNWNDAKSSDVYTVNAKYMESSVWEKELNEEFTSATQMEVNTDFYGSIERGYDYEKDYFKFDLLQDGAVTINFQNPLQPTNEEYWSVELYDSTYESIMGKKIIGSVSTRDLPSVGLPAGTYYIKVLSTNWSDAKSSDVYTINAKYIESSVWEKELNEEFTSATEIDMDTDFYGSITAGYDYEKDYYAFSVNKSNNYSITMKTPNLKNSDRYWTMCLYDSSYEEIERVEIYGNKTEHRIVKYLNPGRYYIRIDSTHWSDAASSETYTLKVISGAKKEVEKLGKVYWKSVSGYKKAVWLYWNEVADADGYEIYMAGTKNGTYKKIGTANNTMFSKNGLKSRKKYFFKVRAYKLVDGKKYYGKFSAIKGVKTK